MIIAGVEGIGQADSKLGIYEGEDGQRGLVFLQVRDPGFFHCRECLILNDVQYMLFFLWPMLGTTECTTLISSLHAMQIINATYRGKLSSN